MINFKVNLVLCTHGLKKKEKKRVEYFQSKTSAYKHMHIKKYNIISVVQSFPLPCDLIYLQKE